MLQKDIIFFGDQCTVACDGRCDKAWGIQGRPRHRFQPEDVDPDDYVYIGDDALGTAPPPYQTEIISEGLNIKPSAVAHSDGTLLNRWCTRQCERSAIVDRGDPVVVPDMRTPAWNKPSPLQRRRGRTHA